MNKINYIIYGIHPIIEVIKAEKRKIIKILISSNSNKNLFDKVKKLIILKNLKIKIELVNKNFLDKISNSNEHQGIVAYVDNFIFKKEFFNPQKEKLILLFDKIQDPRNLGALLRSAYCSNISGVILSTIKSSPLTGSAFKASAGLAENLNIFEVSSSEKGAKLALENGYEIVIADFGGENLINYFPIKPTCLIIGSEGFGVTKSLHKYGKIISIPQKKNDISYNASVAGGLIMFNFAIKMNLLK